MSSGQALVSVLLPVYNGAEHLDQAIQSILEQTYPHFELIIINDGSTDDSPSIIARCRDDRIRVYHQSNQGLAATLNRAIELSSGTYLARQDQDDVSFPQRLEKQVLFMETHPDYGMVGTWASIWVGNTPTQRAHHHPADNHILQFELLFDNPFVHSSMMIRRTAIEKVGLYTTDKTRQPPEDYELWSRISRQFKVANIPETLQIYRETPQSMSRVGPHPFLDRVVDISAENLAWHATEGKIDRDIVALAALYHGAYHRLSAMPGYLRLRRCLLRAVKNLNDSLNGSSNVPSSRIAEALRHIRQNYVHHRYGGRLDRPLSYLERLSKVLGLNLSLSL